MSRVILSTGGNIGDVAHYLSLAKELVAQRVGEVVKSSGVHRSKAWGFEGDDFLNQVLVVETDKLPHEVLDLTQQIERDMGRKSKSTNGCYESRVIDIDILFYDNKEICDERLQIPHPLIGERDFILTLLKEVL